MLLLLLVLLFLYIFGRTEPFFLIELLALLRRCFRVDLAKLLGGLAPRMSANNIRTDFARPNRSLPLLLQTASTNLFLIMLLHLLHGILAVEAKCFNFFISEKFEFLRVFGEIEPFHEFDAHAVEAGTWEVVRPPNINALVYHPEESARQFDEIGQVIVWQILVNLSNKVAAASLNAPDMRSVLNYLDHLGK